MFGFSAFFAVLALAAPAGHDWARFDYDAARSGVYPFATGITAANAGRRTSWVNRVNMSSMDV